jgi:hypothetical protein
METNPFFNRKKLKSNLFGGSCNTPRALIQAERLLDERPSGADLQDDDWATQWRLREKAVEEIVDDERGTLKYSYRGR